MFDPAHPVFVDETAANAATTGGLVPKFGVWV
jgi:hypothetical protein